MSECIGVEIFHKPMSYEKAQSIQANETRPVCLECSRAEGERKRVG